MKKNKALKLNNKQLAEKEKSRFLSSIWAIVLLLLLCLPACDDSSSNVSDAGVDTQEDTGNNGNSCDLKAENCATEDQFGSLFTKTNGRADGILVAIVRPEDQDCAYPNSSHVTLQLSISGGIQRLVVSAVDISFTSVHHSLLGPAYEEGWHEGQNIDYWNDLGVHSTDFTTGTMEDVVAFICENLETGEEVSVFAYSDGTKPTSAHQIHRNDSYPDGAIVVNPASDDPIYLLFRYADQVF